MMSFGRTQLSLQNQYWCLKADVCMFVCSANNNCHLVATFSQQKDLPMPPPLSVLHHVCCSYVAVVKLKTFNRSSESSTMETPYSNSSSAKYSL